VTARVDVAEGAAEDLEGAAVVSVVEEDVADVEASTRLRAHPALPHLQPPLPIMPNFPTIIQPILR